MSCGLACLFSTRVVPSRSDSVRHTLNGLADPQVKTLKELWNALRIHFEGVTLAKSLQGLWRGYSGSSECHEFSKVVFKSRRRDYFEDSRRLITCVPERVPLAARFEDEIAWAGFERVVTKERPTRPSTT
jgi:hypothetical protein